jgi:hypothetical protein
MASCQDVGQKPWLGQEPRFLTALEVFDLIFTEVKNPTGVDFLPREVFDLT